MRIRFALCGDEKKMKRKKERPEASELNDFSKEKSEERKITNFRIRIDINFYF